MTEIFKNTRALGAAALFAAGLVSLPAVAIAEESVSSHGYSVFGTLKNPADFTHYEYANPDAPKGGTLRRGVTGSFDSLQGGIVKGTEVRGLGHTQDRLMAFAHDELGAHYGLVAQSVTVAPDFSWVSYDIRPEARFHDGTPITVEDVIFSFNIYKTESAPIWRSFMTEIKSAEKIGPRTVRFNFTGPNKHKLAYTAGGLTIQSKAYWSTRDFGESTMEPPLGSGPYRIAKVDQGRSITYERVKDYWAKDLPVKRGQHNFDTIIFDYYLDTNTQFQAFKSGEINFRIEYDASNWAQAYTFASVKSKDVVLAAFHTEDPTWMLTMAPNMRLDKFKDIRVREALDLAFDFEWLNKNYLFGLQQRMDSYFDNSRLAATGLPGARERELLEPFKASLPDGFFVTPYHTHQTDGLGNNRKGMVRAMKLLKEAGWEVRGGKLTNAETGEIFRSEFLTNSALMSRMMSPYIIALKKLGIQAETRQVDSSQYFNRISDFDYDMMIVYLPQNSMPTRELRNFWGSRTAHAKGSLNFAGIEDPALDAMIEIITNSNVPEDYFAAIKAADRILLWNHYMTPLYNTPEHRRAYARELKHLPYEGEMFDLGFPARWWYDADDAVVMKH